MENTVSKPVGILMDTACITAASVLVFVGIAYLTGNVTLTKK